jgi:hypothetical protein
MSEYRVSPLFTALCAVLAPSAAAAAAPATAASHYRAEPAAPRTAERLIVRDLVWKCGADGCVTGPSNSRPVVDCAALVRQVGTLRSFTVGGTAIPADQLEKCNARAR